MIENAIRFCGDQYAKMSISLALGHPNIEPKSSSIRNFSQTQKTSESNNPFPLNPKFTLDQFITGRSNEFAFAAAQQTAANPGTVYNPFVIFGSTGLGKTLMQSIGHAVPKKGPLNVFFIFMQKSSCRNDKILPTVPWMHLSQHSPVQIF